MADTATTAKKSPRPGGPCGGGSSSPIPASTAAAFPTAGSGAPDGHVAPAHKVVENSKKKKKFVDLKSMWGRAEKKQKSVVQSNSPEPVQEVGCNKGQELAIVEIEPQFGNGSTEASKPQVASTQSEDEDWWEDYDDDVGYLPHDPGKRIAITDYDANLQDEVRRRYIALGPCRPALQNFPQRNVGGKRRFMRSWFDKYNWLEYSEEKDAAFCFVCYLFKDRINYVGGDSFVNEGFRQWNHLDRFDKHVGSISSAHNLAQEKYDLFIRPNASIRQSIHKRSKHDNIVHKARLTYSLKCLRFLLRQGLACRGHDESEESHNRGNFLELLNWLAENFEEVNKVVLKNAPRNCQMTSPKIQKQLIECCAKETTKLIKEDIGDDFFAILADESSDVYQNEQLALCLRYVDKKGRVVERFLGVVHVENTTALTLKDAIQNLLMKHSLSLSRVRGQGYDGASNMKGEVSGLKKLIMNESPSVYYVHCFAHQLQLTLVAVAKENGDCVWFFEQLGHLLNAIGLSCKKHQMLRVAQAQQIVEALELGDIESGRGLNQEMGLGRPGDTRWGSHYKTVQHLLILYRPIRKVLFRVGKDRSQSMETIKAQTALASFESFEFVFMAHLLNTILGYTDDLNTALQKRDQDIVNAIELIYVTKLQLQLLRQDDGWENFLNEVTSFCTKPKVKVPNMDAQYKPVARSARFFPKVKNHHRFKIEMFLSVIDRQLQELNERFDQVNTYLLVYMASFNPADSFGSFAKENLVKLAQFYPNDFSSTEIMHLPFQLILFVSDMRRDERFREVKSIAALSVMLVDTKKHLSYPLVYKLLKLVLVLPVATASVEKSILSNEFCEEQAKE